jgi:hypothetical protein
MAAAGLNGRCRYHHHHRFFHSKFLVVVVIVLVVIRSDGGDGCCFYILGNAPACFTTPTLLLHRDCQFQCLVH